MAGINDFLAWAIGGGANVTPQADYAALPAVESGYQAGIAQSAQANKTWRQATTMAYVIGQFIVTQRPDLDVLDNADPDVIVAQLELAIQQAAIIKPAPALVTDSANFTAELDVAIYGFNRSSGVAAQQVTLPVGMQPGQQMMFQDLVGNFSAFPITLVPPAGSISGMVNWVLNVDRQTGIITYYGSNLYGVQS